MLAGIRSSNCAVEPSSRTERGTAQTGEKIPIKDVSGFERNTHVPGLRRCSTNSIDHEAVELSVPHPERRSCTIDRLRQGLSRGTSIARRGWCDAEEAFTVLYGLQDAERTSETSREAGDSLQTGQPCLQGRSGRPGRNSGSRRTPGQRGTAFCPTGTLAGVRV